MMWSTRMCPQPPALSSTIWIVAFLPAYSETSQFAQLTNSLLLPVVDLTTAPSTTRFTTVGSLVVPGWLPPPTRKLMWLLAMVNSGDVMVRL
jgi:hypothetical protein